MQMDLFTYSRVLPIYSPILFISPFTYGIHLFPDTFRRMIKIITHSSSFITFFVNARTLSDTNAIPFADYTHFLRRKHFENTVCPNPLNLFVPTKLWSCQRIGIASLENKTFK